MTNSENSIYINAFNLITGIGPQKLYKLSQYFEDFSTAWHADREDFLSCGLSQKIVDTIIKNRTFIEPKNEWQKCINQNIILISILDAAFPKKLKTISNPPFCLYVRGTVEDLNMPSVAIVGSRKISEYGTHATSILAGDIARADISIVSGLALGTDSVAHNSTLENNGITVAVLGGGIDDKTITPRSHISLAKNILNNGGALISEYPIGIQPNRGTFPARNRLMAGLTDATIIIEAAEKSGTLITANYAHKYKRNLFALPGSIFANNSLGPNILIRDGLAKPILSSDDVLKLFHKKQSKKSNQVSFTDQSQEKIYKIIAMNPDGIQINKLIKEVKIDTTIVSSSITMMEIDGVIKNIGNQTYITQK